MYSLKRDQKLELLELIYAAGADPREWGRLVAHLGRLIPDGAIGFQVVDLEQQSQNVYFVENWEEGALEAYAKHFAPISPWVTAHHSASVGTPYLAEDTCPASTYKSSEFYADFIEPYNVMCGAVAVKLFDDAKRMATFSMNYPEQIDRLAIQSIQQLLAELTPHLQRAIEMNGKFAQFEARSRSLEHMSDAIPYPAFLMSGDCAVQHMNDYARQAVKQRRGLVLRPGGIIALERTEDTTKLHRLIRQTARLDQIQLDAGAGLITFTARGESNPNIAFVSPVSNRTADSLICKNGTVVRHVLLTIRYRRAEQPIPHERLMRVFGFTRAESQVVAALARGESLATYAEEMERSVHTIRAQLKQALSKSDCHSQSELIVLVSRLLGQSV